MFIIAIYLNGGGRCEERYDTLKKCEDRVVEISHDGISHSCPVGNFIHRPPQQIIQIHVSEEGTVIPQ